MVLNFLKKYKRVFSEKSLTPIFDTETTNMLYVILVILRKSIILK